MSRSYAEAFFNHLKPPVYTEAIYRRFEQLEADVEEDKRILKRLIIQELNARKRIKIAHEKYVRSQEKRVA